MHARMLHHFPTSGNIVITGAEGTTVPYHNIAREAVCSPLASLGMRKYCACSSYFKAMYSTIACKAATVCAVISLSLHIGM